AQLARIALDDTALQTVLAWSDLLAGAAPFQVEAAVGETSNVPISESTPDSLTAERLAVDGSANGKPCQAIFIDTGAQHTVMTRAAAQAAGVRVQPGEIELAG